MKPLRALVASAILFASAALPAIASDHEEGAIAGIVTNEAGEPLESICVYAYRGDYWSTEDTTDENGAFVLDWLLGAYDVLFRDCDYPRTYAAEWYDDAATREAATPVEVTAGQTTTANAVLAVGGTVTGTVTDMDGAAISDLCVLATGPDGDAWSTTDADGTYSLGGFSTGTTSVQFGCDYPWYYVTPVGATASSVQTPAAAENYVTEWYDDASSQEDATPVAVAVGLETAGIDAQLVLGGAISGTVTDEDGNPLNACVYATSAGSEYGYADVWNGYYRIPGLAADAYRVQFYDCHGYTFASEWFDNVPSYGQATVLDIALGVETTGIDAELARAPMADLAITGLTVKPVPLQTDAVSVPVGTQRDITVELGNLGNKDAPRVGVFVYVRMKNGTRQTLGKRVGLSAAAGETWTETFRWDARRSVGDGTVYAQVCSSHPDARLRNDAASAGTYALIGGTGTGFALDRSDWDYCEPFDYWEW